MLMHLKRLHIYDLFLLWSMGNRKGWVKTKTIAYKEIERRADLMPFEVIAQRLELTQKGILTQN